MKLSDVRTLTCEITSFCNAKCPHCPRFGPEGDLQKNLKLSHWDTEKIFTNLQLDKMTGLTTVILEGDKGDPCMHPELHNIISFFLNSPNKPMVYLTTNGSIQNSNWWADLSSFGDRLHVTFSIDGLEDTNGVYRVRTNYKKIVENYTRFIQNGGRADWKFIVFKHNQHQINDATQLAQNAGFERIRFEYPFINRFLDNTEWEIFDKNKFIGILSPPDLEMEEVFSFTKTFKHVKKYKYNYNHNGTKHLVCPHLSEGEFYITHDHYLIPCCMMHNIMNEKGPIKRRWLQLVEDPCTIKLSHYRFSEIMNSKLYSYNLQNHFLNEAHHYICTKSCHDKIVNKTKRIKLTNW